MKSWFSFWRASSYRLDWPEMERRMAQLDTDIAKLQTSVVALTGAVTAAVKLIADLQAQGVSAAQLQALSDAAATLDAQTAALTAAATPPST